MMEMMKICKMHKLLLQLGLYSEICLSLSYAKKFMPHEHEACVGYVYRVCALSCHVGCDRKRLWDGISGILNLMWAESIAAGPQACAGRSRKGSVASERRVGTGASSIWTLH